MRIIQSTLEGIKLLVRKNILFASLYTNWFNIHQKQMTLVCYFTYWYYMYLYEHWYIISISSVWQKFIPNNPSFIFLISPCRMFERRLKLDLEFDLENQYKCFKYAFVFNTNNFFIVFKSNYFVVTCLVHLSNTMIKGSVFHTRTILSRKVLWVRPVTHQRKAHPWVVWVQVQSTMLGTLLVWSWTAKLPVFGNNSSVQIVVLFAPSQEGW